MRISFPGSYLVVQLKRSMEHRDNGKIAKNVHQHSDHDMREYIHVEGGGHILLLLVQSAVQVRVSKLELVTVVQRSLNEGKFHDNSKRVALLLQRHRGC
jgi:hypothetical protein